MDKQEKNQLNLEDNQSNDQKMVSGSAWMTVASMSSRVIGALYIIPWMYWMGGEELGTAANALYQIGYTPYGFFLALATAGVPSAISKQVSHYNALGDYDMSKAIYKQGLKIMAVTGIVSALAMFVFAPLIAQRSPAANPDEAVLVMRALVPALIIIPSQSVTRGFIQGHNRMAQPAISQIIEQVTRIIFILVAVYIVRQVMGGEMVSAVALSTFAAFVGAIFSIGYLVYKLKRQPTALNATIENQESSLQASSNEVLKEIIKTSIPFILIATGIIVFQFIDQQTYEPIMNFFSDMDETTIQYTYGVTQANAHKLIMVLTSFGTALSIASVPIISDLMVKGDMNEVRRQFSKGIQLLLFAMFPAAVGMAVVAGPLYSAFYGNYSLFTTRITQVSAFMSIFIALYAVLGNVLQAVNQKRPAIWALGAGLIVKLVTQPLFVGPFGAYGMLYSTMAGFAVTCWMMMRVMKEKTEYSTVRLYRRSALILILSLGMGAVTWVASFGLQFVLDYENRVHALIALVILATIGVAVYGYLALRTRLADRLIGHQAARARQKLKIP